MNLKNQTKMHSFNLPIFVVIISGFLLNGCAPAAITAGIAGVAASESEKGLGTTINDTITYVRFRSNINNIITIWQRFKLGDIFF